MHETSLSKMRAFIETYLAAARDRELEIIDVGAMSVDGHATYRPLFQHPAWSYRGLDMAGGTNVDIVVGNPYQWNELPDGSVDVVVCGQVFEHIEYPWRTIAEIARVLRPSGVACLIAPSSGAEHRYPQDCWRIYPDGMAALARSAGLGVVEVFTDWGLGPWQDTFAVLQKPTIVDAAQSPLPILTNQNVGFALYRRALASRPKNPVFYANLARLLDADGRPEEAATTLRIGAEVCPTAVELRHQLIGWSLKEEKLDTAIEHAIALLGLRPINMAVVEAVGDVFSATDGSRRRCLSDLLPPETPVLLRMATLAFSRERYDLSAACWEMLLRAEPENTNHLLNRASAQLGAGRADEARKGFKQALRLQIEKGEINRTTVLQRLISNRNAQVYLEIGVERGNNFFQIQAPVKLGVDPNFKIPGGPRDMGSERFFALTSDGFFADPPPEILQHGIDVALVDGLHTSSQALRDIENCLKHLNPNGVVVVHDCLPASEAEAAPSLASAKSLPGFKGDWTGDVFRAILRLRAKRADLFVAVLDSDHGVGLVHPGRPESALQASPEFIAGCGFHELNAARERLLNLKPARWFERWLNGEAAGDVGDGYSSGLPATVLSFIQNGVMRTRYRGVRFWKSPFDVVIYSQLIERLRPQAIIEVGTLDGGSAAWFADQMACRGLNPKVVSIDKAADPKLNDPRIVFLKADALNLAQGLAAFNWKGLDHPWLVVEDSAHTYPVTSAVLQFFDQLLLPGDYIVVEDGIVRDLPEEIYRRYEDGPNRAVADFLRSRESDYAIDRDLCDFFGPNFTWNPSGYLRRR